MEATSKSKLIQTAKWGTACAQCAFAKAKCSRKPTDLPGSKCDRCNRLLKTCTDQVHKPRKPRQPRQQTKFHDDASSSSHGGFDNRGNASPLVPSSEGSPSASSPAMSFSGCLSPLYYAEQPRESDDDLLQIYQNEFMPRFPFVIVPAGITAEDLNIHRPFLMASIRLAASLRSAGSIRGQVGPIITQFADRIVVRGERNMDLLLGILVLVGWHHYCQIQHSQLNSLLCLTESLIADLGLGQGKRVRDESDMPSTRSEEQRALLGTWYLRSCTAAQFNQLKPIPFTPYIQQCLGEINRDREHESDELMVLLVRIQYLTSRISPHSPDYAVSSIWKGMEGLVQTATPNLSQDAQVTIALYSAALRLQRRSSARFSHTPSSIQSWLESWLSRLPHANSSPLPMSPVFHVVYTIAVSEAISSNPGEPHLWGDRFWAVLEEKTFCSRSLIHDLVLQLVDGGAISSATSRIGSGLPSSESPISDASHSIRRSSTRDTTGIRLELDNPPSGNHTAPGTLLPPATATCATGGADHRGINVTCMPPVPLPHHQQIEMIRQQQQQQQQQQHGYSQQTYHQSHFRQSQMEVDMVDDEQLHWISSQWDSPDHSGVGHGHSYNGVVSVSVPLPVTEAGGGGGGGGDSGVHTDPAALWYHDTTGVAGYGSHAQGQPGNYGHNQG